METQFTLILVLLTINNINCTKVFHPNFGIVNDTEALIQPAFTGKNVVVNNDTSASNLKDEESELEKYIDPIEENEDRGSKIKPRKGVGTEYAGSEISDDNLVSSSTVSSIDLITIGKTENIPLKDEVSVNKTVNNIITSLTTETTQIFEPKYKNTILNISNNNIDIDTSKILKQNLGKVNLEHSDKDVMSQDKNKSILTKNNFGSTTTVSTTPTIIPTTPSLIAVTTPVPKKIIIPTAVITEFSTVASTARKPLIASMKNASKKENSVNTTAIIIIILSVVGICALIGCITYKKLNAYWSRRHYARVDFLIDGLYE